MQSFDSSTSMALGSYMIPRLLLFVTFCAFVTAQECSATAPCEIGCCSSYGFCGWGDAYCGTGCLNSCNAQPECSSSKPCATGCCSIFGNCGLGPDYCAPKNCGSQCEEKAQCDPADWGLAFANTTKCPLNVCCSKYGFCGTTSEFCGDSAVQRPSCSAQGESISRVVGYYESWAIARLCKAMIPETIPQGVYTHINFAFASIDPNTWNVVPSGPLDAQQYSLTRALKTRDIGLEQCILRLLGSVHANLGFTGVDIDWEYPEAPDRNGRGEDFANFPKFLARLRATLNNYHYGLSITLPASFWYLQHFDIQALEESVDWFNVMSYDLHGDWDIGNQWTGAYLNAHTNLTEITDALDLLWRNYIDPSKVNLGWRSTVVAQPWPARPVQRLAAAICREASRDLAVVQLASFSTAIAENELSPSLHPDAAVKTIVWGDDQWVSYDDEDTFKVKADFAKSQCLGGVMVWAISHDDGVGTFSKGLASALGRPIGLDLRLTPLGGFTQIRRGDDPEQASLVDGTGCFGGEVHTFCCLPSPRSLAAAFVAIRAAVPAPPAASPGKPRGGAVPDAFTNCQWSTKQTHSVTDSLVCEDSCPTGNLLVARQSGGCALGNEAYCCKGPAVTAINSRTGLTAEGELPKVVSQDEYMLAFYLDTFYADPTYPAGFEAQYDESPGDGVMRRASKDQTSNLAYLVPLLALYFSSSRPQEYAADGWNHYQVNTGLGFNQIREFMYPFGYNGSPAYDPEYLVSEALCADSTGDDAVEQISAAQASLCSWPGVDGYMPDLPGFTSALSADAAAGLLHLDMPSAVQARSEPGELASLWKRYLYMLSTNPRTDNGRYPTVFAILEGIRAGDLSVHYMRWINYSPNVELILEVVYWIGPPPNVAPSGELLARYSDSTHTTPPGDRWVVFHLHIPIDSYTLNPTVAVDANGLRSRSWFPGVRTLAVYHGQTVNYSPPAAARNYRGRAAWRVQYMNNPSVTNQPDQGMTNYNSRTTALNCPVPNSANTVNRWYIGLDATARIQQVNDQSRRLANSTLFARRLNQWGRQLASAGAFDPTTLARLWPNIAGGTNSGDPGPYNPNFNAGAFDSNFMPDPNMAPYGPP
ncbi:Family 18 glycoside hydrolase [Pleurostoma richardsiae]|uniref:chitinase n=1 Tax=Pleurostoma richardsiae TaxID=41990 RepID=A0AA38RP97_9PEZI|nr:Family 18 glycoside hydrolase [Pleurostoma richardsiae]